MKILLWSSKTLLSCLMGSLIVTNLAVFSSPFQKDAQAQTVAQSNRVNSASQREAIAHLDKAYELAPLISNPKSQALIIGYIASVYIQAGQLNKVEEILGQVLSNPIFSDYQSLSIRLIAEGYAKVGNHNQALILGDRISKSLVGGLGYIANAYAETGQYNRAMAVVNRMPDDVWKSLAIINIHMEARQYDKALLVANKLRSKNPGDGFDLAMRQIASSYAKAGLYDRALAVVNSSVENKLFNNYQQSWAMKDIVLAYGKVKQYDKALAVANQITYAPYKFFAIAYIYTQTGQYDKVLPIVSRISESDPGDIAQVASAYADAGENYQSVLDLISDPQNKLLATIVFHIQRAKKILEIET